MAKSSILFLICAALSCGSLPLHLGSTNMDEEILEEMRARQIPSVAACVLKNDQIVWTGAYGLADKEEGVPATSQTIYLLASLSKTVIATAVMQLAERGLIDIDRDMGLYLPFQVRNPVISLRSFFW